MTPENNLKYSTGNSNLNEIQPSPVTPQVHDYPISWFRSSHSNKTSGPCWRNPSPSIASTQSRANLWIPGPLCVTAHDFHLLGLYLALVIELEIDVLDEKSPDFIAETICIQVAL